MALKSRTYIDSATFFAILTAMLVIAVGIIGYAFSTLDGVSDAVESMSTRTAVIEERIKHIDESRVRILDMLEGMDRDIERLSAERWASFYDDQ